jgi:hypothetical protein
MQIPEQVTIICITTSNLKVVCPHECVIEEIFSQKAIFFSLARHKNLRTQSFRKLLIENIVSYLVRVKPSLIT